MPARSSDFNGDGRADYCRRVGELNGQRSQVACTVSTGTGFGPTHTSPVIDWGYETGRAWADFNGDSKTDYCRVVGEHNGQRSHVACTLSTGTGFGPTHTSPVIDWGYHTMRAWTDFNGDGRADYCRRVGGTNGIDSHLACTVSTGTGFGPTHTSPVIDWGYETGRAWAGNQIRYPKPSAPRPVAPTPGAGGAQRPGGGPSNPAKAPSRIKGVKVVRINQRMVRMLWAKSPRTDRYLVRVLKPASLRTKWITVRRPSVRFRLRQGNHITVAIRAAGPAGNGPIGRWRL
jgi:hypothetical protein